ncbi:MAG: ABC transporter substrate-binding protein [Candidatus Cloacimonetes bacterium]|nr:ABC transporter substrate-binding protein [Candidatus Cloacimonadota bacterium]
MRNQFFFILIFCSIFFLNGCWFNKPSLPERTLKTVLQADPRTLDPALSTSTHSGILLGLIYSNLVSFDTSGKLIYDAAKYYKVSKDGLTYTFALQDGLRFSDGRPVRAVDVVTSLNRLAHPATASPRAWLMEPVAGYQALRDGLTQTLSGVRVLDEKSLEIILSRRFAPFLSYLAMPQTAILPANEVANGEVIPPGSGPYVLSRWVRDTEVLLTRNTQIKTSGNLQAIWFRIIKDPFTIVSEFKSGGLHLIEVPPQEVENLRADKRFRTLDIEEFNVYFLGLNMKSPLLQDIKMREALAHAIPREAILKNLLKGLGTLATGPVPTGLSGFLREGGAEFNLELAKQKLFESGYAGQELRLSVYNDPMNIALCEVIKQSLEEIGVKVRIIPRDWNGFTEQLVNLDYEIYYRNWVADFPDGDNFLFPLYHSTSLGLMGNYSHYNQPGFDSVLEASRQETDSVRREELLREAAVMARDDMSRILLWYKKKVFAVAEAVRDYKPHPMYNSNKFLNTSLTQL